MRTRITIAFLTLLTACAHDDYAVIPDGPGSPQRLSDDLATCKHDAIWTWANNKNHATGVYAPLGLLGGALMAANDAETHPMQPSDINPMIEACMRHKGYVGTSEN